MGTIQWLPLVTLAGGLGCTSLAGLDGDYVVGDTSTGTTTTSGTGGGAGGTTSGTGGSTSGTGGSTSGTGGSTSGTGGSTSGTGGGTGGTGPEDCLDGIDNNGDSLTDCADPLCQVDYECVPDVSQQAWLGYFQRTTVTYPAPSVSPCPDSSSPQVSFSGPGGAATCSACSCGSLTGSCSYPEMGLWANVDNCNGSADFLFTPNDNNCHPFPATCSQSCQNNQSLKLTAQSMASGASCPASGGGATVPPLWSDEHHLCPLPPTGEGCGSGSVCVAKQSCVQQKGAQTCPNEWPQTVDANGNAVDTRDCSNCLCISSLMCQGGKFTIYDDNSCNGGPTPNIDVTAFNCVNGQNHLDWGSGSYRAFAGTLSGSCTPNGGQPIGTVTPTDPMTICCR